MLRRLLSLSLTRSGWLLCLALCHCAPATSDAGSAVMRSAIVDGEPSKAGGIEDAVLLLRTVVDGQEILCTASLVAPNLALTARHCVAHLVEGQFNCSVKGELFDNPSGAGKLGLDLPADSLELYGGALPRKKPLAHGLQIVSTLTDTICVNDIAFVVLDQALTLPVLPLRLHGQAAVGEATTLVGYGLVSDAQANIAVASQPRSRKSGLTIAGVGPDALADGVTTVPPRTVLLQGPSGCVGDSGGPLLADGSNALLGVYSLLAGDSCSDARVRHYLTHVPAFQALTEQAFAAAGATPVPEQPVGELADADVEASSAAGANGDADAAAAAGANGDAGASSAAGATASGGDTRARGGGCATVRHGSSERWPTWLALLLCAIAAGRRAGRARRAQWRPSSGSLGRRGTLTEAAAGTEAAL